MCLYCTTCIKKLYHSLNDPVTKLLPFLSLHYLFGDIVDQSLPCFECLLVVYLCFEG